MIENSTLSILWDKTARTNIKLNIKDQVTPNAAVYEMLFGESELETAFQNSSLVWQEIHKPDQMGMFVSLIGLPIL